MNKVSRFRVNSPAVVHETIDNEVVIIHLASGSYYSLNDGGAATWNMIADEMGLDEIIQGVHEQTGAGIAEVEQAVQELVVELQREDLIASDVAGGSVGIEQSRRTPERAFRLDSLKLHTYTDMQELMALDPIHDVDETGWPNKDARLAR